MHCIGEETLMHAEVYNNSSSLTVLMTHPNTIPHHHIKARQEASLASPSKITARLTPTALKQKIEADYKTAYFLTGAISPEAYDEDCVFTGT